MISDTKINEVNLYNMVGEAKREIKKNIKFIKTRDENNTKIK